MQLTLTFPIARSALSKNSIIPKKRKNTPNPVKPIPISVKQKKIITTHVIYHPVKQINYNFYV